MWLQREIHLKAQPRGFHLVTDEILAQLPELKQVKVGLVHLFIQHTSASLSVNENAAPEVRVDFETFFSRLVPENDRAFLHQDEGPDDLPAHIKASLLGASISLPVSNGRLMLGTWQGIYLCEHRNHASGRKIVITVQGSING